MTEWHDLKELFGDYSVDVAEITYLIGTGVIPDYLVRYHNGQVLVCTELADCICASFNICMDTDLSLSYVIASMMATERNRKGSEATESEN